MLRGFWSASTEWKDVKWPKEKETLDEILGLPKRFAAESCGRVR